MIKKKHHRNKEQNLKTQGRVKNKSHRTSQAHMHKHESLVSSGEADIFWDLLMFLLLPRQKWGQKILKQ